MKSFITFLIETDLNLHQRGLVTGLTTGREQISRRVINDPDHHPVGVGTHHIKPSPRPTRGPKLKGGLE